VSEHRPRAGIVGAGCPDASVTRVDSERGLILLPAIGSAPQQDGIGVRATGELISAQISCVVVDGHAHVSANRRRGRR
jgi:hypothetical protein